jgi:hypothetical protein
VGSPIQNPHQAGLISFWVFVGFRGFSWVLVWVFDGLHHCASAEHNILILQSLLTSWFRVGFGMDCASAKHILVFQIHAVNSFMLQIGLLAINTNPLSSSFLEICVPIAKRCASGV